MADGKLTSRMAKLISTIWEPRGYDVLRHHNSNGDKTNVGKIVSWFGEKYRTGAKLSEVDIAVVRKDSDRILALIEIEDGEEKPKKLISDIFGTLMGDHIHSVYRKCELLIDGHTVFIIIGKSRHPHPERIKYLEEQANRIKPSLSTGNSNIGKVIVDTFDDEIQLEELLKSYLNRAFKREL